MLMTQLAQNIGRKAWTVIGYTFEGNVYCVECEAYTDPTVTGASATDTRVDLPAPVFISDDAPLDWTCVVCESSIH